jgi:tight adherence protein B
MRRRLLLLLAVVAALASGASIARGGSSPQTAPQLTPIGRLSFPERGFLVGLPRHLSLGPANVRVWENGKAVADPSFVPVSQAKQRLGLLLVIDASNSMRGRPLADAFAAARGFVDQVGSSERIGVLTFNPSSRLLLTPTQDPAKLAAALRRLPPTAEGTHIYDALTGALAVLHAQKLAAGAIVLLSDGADTGSQTTSAHVLAQARAEHVRIFTVGLRSSAFQSRPLRALAAGSGAAYSEASSSAQLKAIYDAIGSKLASEYLLRYHSQAKPGEQVTVRVQVLGVGATSYSYTAEKPQAVAPFHRSLWQRFWAWHGSFVVIGLLVMTLVFAAAFALLHSPPSNLRKRLAEFVSIPGMAAAPSEEAPPARRRLLPSKLLPAQTERALARSRRWARFKEELEIAEIKLSPEQIVLATLLVTIFVFALLLLVLPVFSIFTLCVPLVAHNLCRRRLLQVRERFAEQLPDNLQVLASALRAGHSFIGALAVVAADAEPPARREFQRVVADEQLGVPIEVSLREVARRMDSADLEQVALVAELQRQAGGNMAEVLDRVVETIRSRFDLRRLVKTLTAQGRMARWIVSLLPVGLAAFVSMVNPGYMQPLFGSTGGQVAVAFAAAMVIAGSLVIKRIVNIKV